MHSQIESKAVINWNAKSDKERKKPEKNSRISDNCPECGSSNLIHDFDTGETVCGDCGLVVYEQMVDKGPEWRAYDPEEERLRTRTGMPTKFNRADKGLLTDIGKEDRDAFGRKLSLKTRIQMGRLRKWQRHSRVQSSVEMNIAKALSELDRLTGKLLIPPATQEKAAIFYRTVVKKRITRGHPIIAVVAAALYVTCRTTGTLRTLNEVADASLADKKEVAKCYRLIINGLEMKMPFQDPVSCVSKIAEKTGISGESQGLAIRLLRDAGERKFNKMAHHGKDPMGMAAAALYIACLIRNEGKTQKDIADVAGVTDVTVRNREKTLVDTLKLVLPRH